MKENPFECLKQLEYFKHSSDTIVKNWYQARKYVLDLLINRLHSCKDSDSFPECWHFIVYGDSELMLSVVRHLALYAHFISYEEYDRYGNLSCKNRTVITVVSKKSAEEIKVELQKPEFLGNLPKYCPVTVFGEVMNKDSYIDIAIEVVKDPHSSCTTSDCEPIDIKEDEVLQTEFTQDIDTYKAVCAGKAYGLGKVINNLPYEDINSVSRYSNALSTFKEKILSAESENLINEKWGHNSNEVRCGISNVFCADCFEIREKEILNKAKTEKMSEMETWQKYFEELSHCEHNRWVVEKLILGYEPLGREERFKYEQFFGDERTAYWKSLKKKEVSPQHIDICSNRDLRRIDPDNMKYDSFLMLAIQFILLDVKTKS